MLCNDNAIIEYDKRISGLPSAPLDMEYDINSIEYEYVINLKIQYRLSVENILHLRS